jgi:ribosomal protein L11 methylase PrmA
LGLVPPKWLGAYEAELADIVEAIIKHGHSRILNIGCAEGYYAVGLALRDRASEVFAFDIDPISRVQTHRLARLNEVSDQVLFAASATISVWRT